MMTDWAQLISKHLPLRPDACRSVLSELSRFPVVLKELLLSPEESVRYAAALVAGVALKRCMLAASRAGGTGHKGETEDVDVYLEAYAVVADDQGQQEAEGLREGPSGGGRAEGVPGEGKEGVATEGEDEDDDDVSLAKKTVRWVSVHGGGAAHDSGDKVLKPVWRCC